MLAPFIICKATTEYVYIGSNPPNVFEVLNAMVIYYLAHEARAPTVFPPRGEDPLIGCHISLIKLVQIRCISDIAARDHVPLKKTFPSQFLIVLVFTKRTKPPGHTRMRITKA
jgi:hypothetical protein